MFEILNLLARIECHCRFVKSSSYSDLKSTFWSSECKTKSHSCFPQTSMPMVTLLQSCSRLFLAIGTHTKTLYEVIQYTFRQTRRPTEAYFLALSPFQKEIHEQNASSKGASEDSLVHFGGKIVRAGPKIPKVPLKHAFVRQGQIRIRMSEFVCFSFLQNYESYVHLSSSGTCCEKQEQSRTLKNVPWCWALRFQPKASQQRNTRHDYRE